MATLKRGVFSELMESVVAMKSHRRGKITLRSHYIEVAPLPKVDFKLIRRRWCFWCVNTQTRWKGWTNSQRGNARLSVSRQANSSRERSCRMQQSGGSTYRCVPSESCLCSFAPFFYKFLGSLFRPLSTES
jgi:hypothetical protein